VGADERRRPPHLDLPDLTIEIDSHELSLNVVGVFDEQAGHVERWLVATSGGALADADYELVAPRISHPEGMESYERHRQKGTPKTLG
jgi:hypothetical protein